MDDQPDEEQGPAFEEAEDTPEATFAIDGVLLTHPVLTGRAGMGHWTSSFLDALLRQTRPWC
jgi:hypothetical protein